MVCAIILQTAPLSHFEENNMDKMKFVLMTAAGLLTELLSGAIMIVIGAVTDLLYEQPLIFVAIGVALSIALGFLFRAVLRMADRMHVNTQLYMSIVRVLPITLMICCLLATPLLLMFGLIKSFLELVSVAIMLVCAIITFGTANLIDKVVSLRKRDGDMQ